jgi:FAD/FMN-containing dehydrogenase
MKRPFQIRTNHHRRAEAVGSLEDDLRPTISDEVRPGHGCRVHSAADAPDYRQLRIGVVIPRDKEDIAAAVEVCRNHGVPVLMRGGGTRLAGQCCNVAVAFDTPKCVRHVLDIDPAGNRARVLPGTTRRP